MPSRMREREQELHHHDLVEEVQCIPGVQLRAPLLHLFLGHLPMWLLRNYRVEHACLLGGTTWTSELLKNGQIYK